MGRELKKKRGEGGRGKDSERESGGGQEGKEMETDSETDGTRDKS